MDACLETEEIAGDLRQLFRECIALDHDQDFVNDEDLWDKMTEVESFKNEGFLIKPARWFGWNQCCSEYLVECHNNVAHLRCCGHSILPDDVVMETPVHCNGTLNSCGIQANAIFEVPSLHKLIFFQKKVLLVA